jgi:deoxyadenosine/deoxycytidine kinase
VFSGNLAAGKSTLASLVGVELGARVFLESTSDNPFLSLFYQDRSTWALHLETYFMARRSRQLLEASQAGVPAILDRSFYESRIFIESGWDSGLVPAESYAVLRELEDTLDRLLPRPALLVYLHAPVRVLYDRLRARARPFERSVEVSYLSDLQTRYDKWVEAYDYSPVLRVDTTEQDFARDAGAVRHLAARIKREVPLRGPSRLTNRSI